MSAIDGDDRELLAAGVRHAVEADAPDDALAALGWADALAADRRTAVSLLFEAQGAACSTSSALDVVVAGALGITDDVAVVLAPGLVSSKVLRVDHALVGTAPGAVLVRTSELALRPVAGIDPALGLVEVGAPPAGTGVPVGSSPWPVGVAAGQLALAHELLGASRAMLEHARRHALDRTQFDRPVASFQAVRHRLAEAYVAVEAAAAAIASAWDDGTPLLAAAAKAIAGRSASAVAGHAQQVLAGVGFTTEHPLQRYVKRTMVLDHLLGDARTLTAAMGEDLLATRRIPALLEL